MKKIVQIEWIQERIYLIRGSKVMLSHDLAQIYGVEPRTLMQAVKRNLERFPADFVFHLENQEVMNLKSQFVISSWGGSRVAPYAFTELGISMLSSVLNNSLAIQINIEIMRTFVNLRKYLELHRELAEKLNQLEGKYDHQFKLVFDALREIMSVPDSGDREIGIYTKK